MTFLAPWALFGLALLAIPVVVHLFKPRHVRQTPFSSLRWLNLTQQRMARRIQWHQVLLFALRAAFLTFLVLALARPLWTATGDAGVRDRIVVLDVSRSMGRRIEGRSRPIEAARAIAADALRAMRPGDRAAVLLAGTRTTVLAPWTTDPAPHLPALDALESGPTGTDLDSSLETIRSLMNSRRANAAVEVHFLTDVASGSWTSAGVGAFVEGLSEKERGAISIRVVDVGLPSANNGWLIGARLRETATGTTLRVEATCAGETAQTRTLKVDGLSGVEPLSGQVALRPGRVAVFEQPLPAAFRRDGSRARVSLDPADELPDDDEWFADLDAAGSLRVLVVETDAPADESRRAGFPLRTAIQALADAGSAAGDATVTVRSPGAIVPADIDAADVIVLADVPGVTSAVAQRLTERVAQGAGLVAFLGPAVDVALWNERFVDPLRPSESLLPARLSVPVRAADPGLDAWGRWNVRHPLLDGLLDPLLGDLAQTRSRSHVRLDGPIPESDEVLASFDDGTAALVVRRVGAGRVVLFNASADDATCDLPRRKSFVPLVDRLLSLLDATGRARSFAAGEPVALALPQSFKGVPRVRTPSGETLIPRVEERSVGRWPRRIGFPCGHNGNEFGREERSR